MKFCILWNRKWLSQTGSATGRFKIFSSRTCFLNTDSNLKWNCEYFETGSSIKIQKFQVSNMFLKLDSNFKWNFENFHTRTTLLKPEVLLKFTILTLRTCFWITYWNAKWNFEHFENNITLLEPELSLKFTILDLEHVFEWQMKIFLLKPDLQWKFWAFKQVFEDRI